MTKKYQYIIACYAKEALSIRNNSEKSLQRFL